MAAPTSSRLFIHVQNEEQCGPFGVTENADVVECTHRILSKSFEREKLNIDGDICLELPRIPCDLEYSLVLVTAKENTHVYVVEMKEEAVSLDEIRSYMYAVYGSSSFSKDSLRPYEEDKADQSSSEKVYAKGSVFKGKKTLIEAPTNQPVTVSPSQESSFSSSSSSREGPIVISQSSSLSKATAAESDHGVGQKTNPLVFHTPNEGKTSPATEQPMPGSTLTAHEFKEEDAVSSVLSKSEMVAPQLATQKVFVGTPRHSSGAQANSNASSHVLQDKSEQRRVVKEEDSVATYTADTVFDFAKDEEKTDEMEPKVSKNNMIQQRVNFFENCFKPEMPASSTGVRRRRKMARPHWMAHKFMRSAHEERCLGPENTRTVKDGVSSQLGVRCKDPSMCIPDINTCSAPLQSSESEEEKMDRVHALEHVYNNKCFKTGCRKQPREESLQTVLRLKEAHCTGTLGPELAKLFKEYILVHCERCSDINCRVPHMAAGCPHPRTVHAGQIHKGIAACMNTESISVTKKPGSDNIARFGSLDVSCKIPSTSGECQASAQLLNSEIKEEKAASASNHKELMDKAHILEHACNKKCFLEAGCTNPPSTKSLQQMSRMVEAHERGTLDHKATQLFKEYISTHCERCNDVNCKIPHMAAGCPHPGIPQNLDPYLLNFTDGQQLVAQATDNDSPSTKNIVYLKMVKQPPELKAESSAAGSDKQQSEEISSQPKNGKFLPLSVIRNQPKFNELNSLAPWLIYCSPTFSELTGLGFGLCVDNLFQQTGFLGEGGNGRVYEWSYRLSGQKFASKHTRYRPLELNIWSDLDHENLISLYGVLFCSSAWVYQLMPRITGSFQKEIEKIHTLRSLVQRQKLKNEPVGLIFKNVYYIYQKVAAGLNYLHHKGLVHGDIKASNILISKPPTCRCHSVLLCTCQYKVFISDFDSVGHGSASFLIKDRIIVLHPGTLFYRAPEAHLSIKGPWYDLWSIGCSLNHLILGRYSADEKKKAYGIGKSPTDIFSINPLLLLVVETCDACEQLVLLRDNLCKEYPEFDPLVSVISDCLHLDYTRRITASVLYEKFVLIQ